MAVPQRFDYEGAVNAGYNDDEILPFLTEKFPRFDFSGAQGAGYNLREISDFLSSRKPEHSGHERSGLEKGGRLAAQYALGAAESAALPYELAAAPLASKEAQQVPYRENVLEDISRLEEQKMMGIPLDEQDQALYQSLREQIENPEKAEQFIPTSDVGLRGLAEKATGLDLHPEGVLEKAASWAGFVKDPKKLTELTKTGVKLPQLMKAIMPTGKEALRGLGAGVGLEMAEEGDFGPIGTMAAAVVGDITGSGAAAGVKGVTKLVTQPKKTLAEIAKAFTPKEKMALQKEIIKDFRDSGIQADLGSITNNNLIKWAQSRLAQSGLSGRALDEFKDQLTTQIKDEYKKLADGLGEAKFINNHEAGETVKAWLRDIRDSDLSETRELYKRAEESLKDNSYVNPNRLAAAIEKLEKSVSPGSIKSTEQKNVINALDNLKKDIYDSSGKLMYAKVKDLMNNKIALNDIINYEVQGGAKQLLKGIVSELDRAIISYGKENPSFAKNYINANKRFAEHAKTFRNKSIDQILRLHDPAQLMTRMNSVQGIKDISNILKKTPGGKEAFDNLRRLKLDQIVNDNLIDSTTQQVKLGTFSKLAEKGKNAELLKELLGSKDFLRLQKLQKNAGRLADAANKFYNASKSGAVAADAAVLAKGLGDIANILMGNPWPLIKTIGSVYGIRQLTQLLADSEFLKLVEDVILNSEKENLRELMFSVERLRPYLLPVMNHANET